MAAEIILLGILPLLLILAAGWDLTSFTIPNRLTLAVAACFPLFAFTAGFSLAETGWHFFAGGVGLLISMVLFFFRFIGGGDAKLFAAAALWLGFGDLAGYALAVSLLGGGLTLVLLLFRQLPLPAIACRQRWILRLHDNASGIPYGVALSGGFLIILPQVDIFMKLPG